MRIALPTGLVAASLAAAALFLLRPPPVARAADALNAAVENTAAYKGWVHGTATIPPDATPSNTPIPTRVSFHANTTTGANAEVREFADDLQVRFLDPAARQAAAYSQKTNELVLTSLNDEQLRELRTHPAPTTVAQQLALFKQEENQSPSTVKQSSDGNLTRFDVSFPSDNDIPQSFTFWVNADSLIVRVHVDNPVAPYTLDVTYGPPEIHDVYDLGVPRTAKRLDRRINKDLQILLSRLDARALNAFPNTTTLLAQYDVDADGNALTDDGFVTLVASKGKAWLALEYRLLARPTSLFHNAVLKSAPANWPDPDLQTLLPALQSAAPLTLYIFTDTEGWSARYNYTINRLAGLQTQPPKVRNVMIPSVGFARYLWPNSIRDGLTGPDAHLSLLANDPAHPRLLGLHWTRTGSMGNQPYTTDTTWWLDPARDDLPVERTSTTTGALTSSSHITYSDFTQLPDGQWYPAHWRDDRTDRDPTSPKLTPTSTDFHLRIDPTLQLPDDWFQPPGSPVTQP
jgi:hypothetical protein